MSELSRHFGVDLLKTPAGTAYLYTQSLGCGLARTLCVHREAIRHFPPQDYSPYARGDCSANIEALVRAVTHTLEPVRSPPPLSFD